MDNGGEQNESRISDATWSIANETISTRVQQNNQNVGSQILFHFQLARWHNGAGGGNLPLHGKARQMPYILQWRSRRSKTYPQGLQGAHL